MAYNRHTWVAPQGTNLNRFTKSNETPVSVDLIQNPNITNNPTPFSVEWMNDIEAGIFEAHERLDSRYGVVEPLMFHPTVLELAQMRCLPLEGQVITISTYQRLCNRMYVGDGKNATADWWYKISDPNNKNSRNTSGAYMVVADLRGIFLRGAGENSKYKAANDTPYDGKSLGSFNQDTALNHVHFFVDSSNGQEIPYLYLRDLAGNDGFDSGFHVNTGNKNSRADAVMQLGDIFGYGGRKGIETAPVWGAVLYVIVY